MILSAHGLRSPGTGGRVEVPRDMFGQPYRQPSQQTWSRDGQSRVNRAG